MLAGIQTGTVAIARNAMADGGIYIVEIPTVEDMKIRDSNVGDE